MIMDFIPVNIPAIEGNELKYVSDAIESGWISSEGAYVKKIEDDFSSIVNRQFGIAVTNGTAALDAAIAALGIGAGDEVILPAFTIISCVGQIVRSGAIPVLVDSDLSTLNMDVDQIESKITSRTKAIMVVHMYGLPVDIDPILSLASRYNLRVIEDAAEMIGQTYKGRPCGSFGDISTFSFYANKHITTGEGGMIVVNDSALAEDCRSLRNLCFKANTRFVHDRLGWNLRMTNVQAAIGVAQIEQLEKFIKRKRKMGRLYAKLLEDIPNIQLPMVQTDYAENIYWVFGIVLGSKHKLNAAMAIKKLGQRGIGCRPFFCPMHQQPVLTDMGLFSGESYPVAESLYDRGFYIPSGLGLTVSEIHQVAKIVREILL
jgi:perosamine synthetase